MKRNRQIYFFHSKRRNNIVGTTRPPSKCKIDSKQRKRSDLHPKPFESIFPPHPNAQSDRKSRSRRGSNGGHPARCVLGGAAAGPAAAHARHSRQRPPTNPPCPPARRWGQHAHFTSPVPAERHQRPDELAGLDAPRRRVRVRRGGDVPHHLRVGALGKKEKSFGPMRRWKHGERPPPSFFTPPPPPWVPLTTEPCKEAMQQGSS